MMKRRLGRSDIEVSALGFGCMEIGGKMEDREGYLLDNMARNHVPIFFLGEVDDEQSLRALAYASDAGINFFDTAPAYGAGRSERILGRAFARKRDKVVIATKFGKLIDENENWFGRYPNARALIGSIRKECEESLLRLGTDYIDLYQYHQMDYSLLEFAEELIAILERLVEEGKIRYYGWSTEDPACIRMFAQGEHCTAIQHSLNVLEDAPEPLALCDEFDQASIARGILGMGLLSGKYSAKNYKTLLSENDFRQRMAPSFAPLFENLDKVHDILTRHGRTLPQGALAWIWARSRRCIPIPGFRTFEQVKENIEAVDFGSLTDDQMNQIDRVLERELRPHD
jgi:aryl-alcohol dehydrogenase-like predicted oxidoreductase